PFVTEEMYRNLAVNTGMSDAKESVHLEDYPEFAQDDVDTKVLEEMESVRNLCSLGLKIRDTKRLKLRQPLAKAYVNIENKELLEIAKAELNVKEVEYSKTKPKGEGIEVAES